MNDIQEAVLQGIREEFASESQYEFVAPNNPIEMLVDGDFKCEIRTNTQDTRIEVWTPTGKGWSLVGGKARPSCYPLKMIPLESPTCFDDLFSTLRELACRDSNPD